MLEPTAGGGPYPADLLDKKYWDHNYDATQPGDPNVDMIFEAVGRALTSWEWLEDQISSLYLRMMLCQDSEQMLLIKRAFGSVESSATRRGMVLQTAKMYFNYDWDQKEVREPIIKLTDAISYASRRRDEFAHGRGSLYHIDGMNVGAFLLSADYSTRKNEVITNKHHEDDVLGYNSSVYRYKSADIISFASKFSMLSQYVMHYTIAIMKQPRQRPNNVLAVYQRKASSRTQSKHE